MARIPINSGWIEVICGGMFSGKTEELMRRLRRAEIAKMSISIFKPKIDSRYDEGHIVSHNKDKMMSFLIDKPKEIINASLNTTNSMDTKLNIQLQLKNDEGFLVVLLAALPNGALIKFYNKFSELLPDELSIDGQGFPVQLNQFFRLNIFFSFYECILSPFLNSIFLRPIQISNLLNVILQDQIHYLVFLF